MSALEPAHFTRTISLLAMLVASACHHRPQDEHLSRLPDSRCDDYACADLRYAAAVGAAWTSDPAGSLPRIGTLTPIVPGNGQAIWSGDLEPRVLVVTVFKSAYAKTYTTPGVGGVVSIDWGDLWVTAAPALQRSCAGTAPVDAERRVTEMLGMEWPKQGDSRSVVELWARPTDLFRPCPDPEITDATCERDFRDDARTEHRQWMNEPSRRKYPLSRLGYTVDWGWQRPRVGLSEFVVRKGSSVEVKALPVLLQEYCAAVPARP